MPRGSFSRTVARAAASGGSRSYRARRPVSWYTLIALIVIGGIVLVGYSRTERLQSKTAATGPPTKSANWNVALAFDICGKLEANLPASSNLNKVGIRTFGNGLINITPAIAAHPANYEGAKATLGKFIKYYNGLLLSSETVIIPSAGRSWVSGQKCTTPLKGKSYVTVKVWPSPSATGAVYKGSNPLDIRLENRQMITIAFVPKGASIPAPPSKSKLPKA